MYNIAYSEERNRIYIKLIGIMNDVEDKEYINEMICMLDKVKPGFTVCANLLEAHISVIKNRSKFDVVRAYGKYKKLDKVAVVVRKEVFKDISSNDDRSASNIFDNLLGAENYLNGSQT